MKSPVLLLSAALITLSCTSRDSPTGQDLAPSFELAEVNVCEGSFIIDTKEKLERFVARQCTQVEGYLYIINSEEIGNLDGLSTLTSVGGDLSISSLPLLTNLEGLEGLTAVGGKLLIGFNDALTTLDGLSALASVGGTLGVAFNPALKSTQGLSALTFVGGDELFFSNNDALPNLKGLEALTSVGGDVGIDLNPSLTSLIGLQSLTYVGGNLYIRDNPLLADLDGLSALTKVGGNLGVNYNPALQSVAGLSALRWVEGHFRIQSNDVLTSLAGLSGLMGVGGFVRVQLNPQLSDCACGLYPLLEWGTVGGEIVFSDNAEWCSQVHDPDAWGFCTPVDWDGDGIYNDVDPEVNGKGLKFTDGNEYGVDGTSGYILEPTDYSVEVFDHEDPSLGVWVWNPGPSIAMVKAFGEEDCRGSGQFWLGPEEGQEVTCGSITVKATHGDVENLFQDLHGREAETLLLEGQGLSFHPETFSFTAPDDNTEELIVSVEGIEFPFGPGESKALQAVQIDIMPGDDVSCINNDGRGLIPVAILGAADFDVTRVDVGTIAFEGLEIAARGRADRLLAHVEDVNGDGFDDLVVQIQDTDGTFAAGSGTAVLTGKRFDGTAFGGSDAICVIPVGS
jgi:hypothetical protein